MKRSILFLLPLLVVPFLIQTLVAQEADEKKMADETTSMIPEVWEFHDVIYVLWHKGFPEKDVALIRSKETAVMKFMEELPTYALPGILRDKREKWDAAVKAFTESAADFSGAVLGKDTQKLLDATEVLHARYEGLIRVLRPVMKELDAYHVVLYKIYHKLLPDMLVEELRETSVALAETCTPLLEAAVPKRLAAKEDRFNRNRQALCEATNALVAISKAGDRHRIRDAVEDVHTKYQILEKMFE